MPNTLTEKAIRQPFRVGLMFGALTLPSLWVASKDVWRWLQEMRWLDSEQVTQVFGRVVVPGWFLGAGAWGDRAESLHGERRSGPHRVPGLGVGMNGGAVSTRPPRKAPGKPTETRSWAGSGSTSPTRSATSRSGGQG